MQDYSYGEETYYEVERGLHWGWFLMSLFFGPFMFFILLIRNYTPERHMRRFKSTCYGWMAWLILGFLMYFLIFASIIAALTSSSASDGIII